MKFNDESNQKIVMISFSWTVNEWIIWWISLREIQSQKWNSRRWKALNNIDPNGIGEGIYWIVLMVEIAWTVQLETN